MTTAAVGPQLASGHEVDTTELSSKSEPRVSAKHQQSLTSQFIVSGVSVATATCVTNPIDVVKTRLQLQKWNGVAPQQRLGMGSTMAHIVRNEGLPALWSGLGPAVVRGLTYGGLRLGMYQPIKDMLQQVHSRDASSSSFTIKVLAGATSGGVAAALTSPTELIKTRLQAQSGQGLTALQAVRLVISQHGILGLWRGAVPGVTRASLLTASQCATYDATKRKVMNTLGWSDHAGTQVACALITGLVSTTITNPADVIKTAMYVGGASHQGPLDAARALIHHEGAWSLMKGWSANYSRLGPQTLVTFLVAEQLRRHVGLTGL